MRTVARMLFLVSAGVCLLVLALHLATTHWLQTDSRFAVAMRVQTRRYWHIGEPDAFGAGRSRIHTDPWEEAFVVRPDARNANHVFIYSKGPNRIDENLAGDDILVMDNGAQDSRGCTPGVFDDGDLLLSARVLVSQWFHEVLPLAGILAGVVGWVLTLRRGSEKLVGGATGSSSFCERPNLP